MAIPINKLTVLEKRSAGFANRDRVALNGSFTPSGSFSIRPALVSIVVLLHLSVYATADDFEKVRLRLVNGSSIRANIDAIESDGKISGSEIINGISLSQIVQIDTGRAGGKVSEAESEPRVVLNSDGWLPFNAGQEIRLQNDVLVFGISKEKLSLPIEAVRGIVWTENETVDENIQNPSGEFDSVLVATKNGTRVVPGLIESVNSAHVTMMYKSELKKISLDKVEAIVMADIGEDEPAGTIATVTNVDGSKLVGAIRQFKNGVLEMAITEAVQIPLKADDIVKIVIRSDRVAYLSDLELHSYEQQTQFVAARLWQRDKSLLGNPIRLKYVSTGRDLEFEKGIGTRSYTSLVFRNHKNFNQFRAVVGIDAETSGQGDCVMVVEGDGILLWSKRIRATDDPQPIHLEIEGIDEVALKVLPGENFDLADHANWADARFIKTK